MQLSSLTKKIEQSKRIVIMGVGSVLRSDDAAGMRLIEKLQELNVSKFDNVLLLSGSTAPENFTGEIKAHTPDLLIVVDAADMNLAAGEINAIQNNDISGFSFSTHMLPLPIIINYLNKEIPFETLYIGIQPKNTDFGFELSKEVENSVIELSAYFNSTIRN